MTLVCVCVYYQPLTLWLFEIQTVLSSQVAAHSTMSSPPPPPVAQLGLDGEFAGNDVIVAFSRAFSANVVIHQLNSLRWEILAPPTATPTSSRQPPTVHIAYLNGEHYCSVRPLVADGSSSLPGPLSTAKSVSRELTKNKKR